MQGIYKITNTENGQVYIGRSTDIENRWRQHREALEKGTHHSSKLQKCYDELLDKNALQYEVIELVDNISEMPKREQYYYDQYDSYNNGYNCCPYADNPKYHKHNLVFYEGWLDALINLSKISGNNFAKDAAWEILNYGIKGEYSTTDENLIGFIDGLCYAQIKKSQNRYEACRKNGEQGGAPPQYDHNEMIELYKQGMNINQISKKVNCSYNAVRNVISKYKATIEGDDEI